MSLSEGKMFTIEALNRIEGFVWPEGATFGEVDGGRFVYFYASDEGIQGAISSARIKQDDDPMTLHVQITREEFDSVDGWVRNDGNEPVINGDFDLKLADNEMIYFSDVGVDGWNWSVQCGDGNTITHWRYHKPQKQEVKPEPESIETMIRRYKDAGENKRAAIDKLNQAQADVEQAEALEDSLFMAIESWAESHGFDIRVLSESEERFTLNADIPMPENPIPLHASSLVITDWRDLQIDDVVAWNVVGYRGEFTVCELYRDNEGGNPCAAITAPNGKQYNVYADELKFIRRPEKK